PALAGALEDRDTRVVLAAGEVLNKIGALNDAAPRLISALKASDPSTRLGSAKVLGMLRSPPRATVPALIAMLDDDNLYLSLAAVRVLEKIEPLPEKAQRLLTAGCKGKLAGEWLVVASECDGVKSDYRKSDFAEKGKGIPLIAAHGRWEATWGYRGTYKDSATETPGEIDVVMTIPRLS